MLSPPTSHADPPPLFLENGEVIRLRGNWLWMETESGRKMAFVFLFSKVMGGNWQNSASVFFFFVIF